jgi:hypothetical protein
MDKLHRHIAAVRRALACRVLADSLGWSLAVVAAAALLAVILQRLLHISLPMGLLWAGLALAVVAATVRTLFKAPRSHEAAIAIDQALGLQERFSTALHVGQSTDPFAQAAVLDAVHAADSVNVRGRFPLRFPRSGYYAAALALLALASTLLPPMDLFGRQAKLAARQQQLATVAAAEKVVKDALATVNSIADRVGPNEQVELARKALEQLENQPVKEPTATKMTAAQVLQDLKDALADEARRVKQADRQAAQQAVKLFEKLDPAAQDKGPLADVRRDMAKGDFASAMEKLQDAVEKFDRMDPAQKQEAAQQANKLAQQLQQLANDPQVQQQMQQQLQQALGQCQNPQQAQQNAAKMQQLMQQAAAGNQQAAQQLQQMAQQAIQQMQANPRQKQAAQQALQQAMRQCQANANAQCQAGQLAQGAQQLAQAMQQAAQAGQNGQMAGAQQQLQQAMQNAMQQMQGAQQAANMQQAMQQAQQAANQAAGACNNPGNGQGAPGQQPGQWQPGNAQQAGGAIGGPGIGAGGVAQKSDAPFGTVASQSPTQHDPAGKMLSSTLVKDGQWIKGADTATLREVAKAGQREQTDEVEDMHIGRKAAQAVKTYFSKMEQDAGKPTPEPRP